MSNSAPLVTPLPLGDLAKAGALPSFIPEKPKPGFWSSNPVFSFVNDVYGNFNDHRKAIGLMNPGTFENLNKEVSKDVFLTQYFFTGLRADLNKTFCLNPPFQTSHSLSIGSKTMPPYAFSALFASDTLFAQGSIDNQYNLNGRLNYSWAKECISKVTLQLSQSSQSMVQLEQDFQGVDYSINLKALNPSVLNGELTGVIVGSLLQSVTQNLAIGLETVYSRINPSDPADAATSYVFRYKSPNNWMCSGQLQSQGSIVGSYWRKVSDQLEAGIETQLQGSAKPVSDGKGNIIGIQSLFEGLTTIGAKYEFRQSVFRGQVDSDGKVAAFLEKRILPTVSILFSGEIDHWKEENRLGLGLQFEAPGNEQIMMMQQGLVDANGNPVAMQ